MADSDFKNTGDTHSGNPAVDAARGSGQNDPFPPEGTDEKIISSVRKGEDAISEEEGLKATKAALSYEAGGGKGAGLVRIVTAFVSAFLTGFFRTTPHRTQLRHDKKLRDNLDEGQIDAMIDDSFPASDPPSSY